MPNDRNDACYPSQTRMRPCKWGKKRSRSIASNWKWRGVMISKTLGDAKVVGIVGHLNSGVTIPASAIYNQAGIPFISGSSPN